MTPRRWTLLTTEPPSLWGSALRLASSRLALGIGVGLLLMGVLNLSTDRALAAGLLIAGITAILLAAVGHWRLHHQLLEES